MDCIRIPVALFKSPKYRRISHADRDLLFNLYYLFGTNTEPFVVSPEILETLGYRSPGTHFPRFRSLRENGFLQAGRIKTKVPGAPRVWYRFVHQVEAA